MTNHPSRTKTYAVGVQHYYNYNSGLGWEVMDASNGGVERHRMTITEARDLAASRPDPEGSEVTVYDDHGEPIASAGRGSKILSKI